MKQTFFLTTPIYYVNGAPHIGHAYTSVCADVLARFKRLDGFDVFFLTGTDEHGQKVEKAALDAGVDPQTFTDQISADFRAMADAMGVSYDDWIRTTEQRHKVSTQELWRRIDASGNITLGHYEGWYAVRDEAFYDESELTRQPDGSRIATASGAPVEWVREPSYFFTLSAFQDRLLRHYGENPDFIAPSSSRSEVLSFVKGGLQDLSISRTTFRWGIEVPGAPDHVMYVWLDALNNYVTACGFPDRDAERWRYWPADVHFVGKEITRFHAVYWPAFLMAAGLPLPRRVTANGWWLVEGQKMSKSLGNVIDPRDLVARYGLDQTRYYLLREKPFGGDGSISYRGIATRSNVELANDLGNLAQRTLSLVARNCNGRLPAHGEPAEADLVLLAAADTLLPAVRDHMDRQTFNEALEEIWKVIRAANAYIDHQAPWALAKTDRTRMASVLRVLTDTIRTVATLLQPFMPTSMGRMLDQLGVPADARDFEGLGARQPAGTPLPPPQGIFPRYVEPAA
jgi:methionyl-tRNA synthetase